MRKHARLITHRLLTDNSKLESLTTRDSKQARLVKAKGDNFIFLCYTKKKSFANLVLAIRGKRVCGAIKLSRKRKLSAQQKRTAKSEGFSRIRIEKRKVRDERRLIDKSFQ